MAGVLASFLAGAAGRPFAWGHHDCGTLIADWVLVRRGIDPAAALRGTYTGMADLRLGWGGYPRLVARCLRSAGLEATRSPGAGDVAVIELPGGEPTGAIRTDRGWAVISQGGGISTAPLSARVIAAWKV